MTWERRSCLIPRPQPYGLSLRSHDEYGSDAVTGIQLVTDAGWMFGRQTVQVDNVTINNATYGSEGRGQGGGDDSDESGDDEGGD